MNKQTTIHAATRGLFQHCTGVSVLRLVHALLQLMATEGFLDESLMATTQGGSIFSGSQPYKL